MFSVKSLTIGKSGYIPAWIAASLYHAAYHWSELSWESGFCCAETVPTAGTLY